MSTLRQSDSTGHGVSTTLRPQTILLKLFVALAQILGSQGPGSYGEGVVGERNQTSAGTSGFWWRGEGSGWGVGVGASRPLSMVLGRRRRPFSVPTRSSGVKRGRETDSSCGWEFFLPANVENMHVTAQFKLYFKSVLLYSVYTV